MEHPKCGPWPCAAGCGKGLTADLAHALAAMNATVPLELGPPCKSVHDDGKNITCERACDDADPREQGVCLKRVWIYEDNLLGMLLAPFKYQLVHDKRFHVVPGPPSDRYDGAPGIPPSPTSLLVDRHDFKHAMGVVDFLEATHAAALSALQTQLDDAPASPPEPLLALAGRIQMCVFSLSMLLEANWILPSMPTACH